MNRTPQEITALETEFFNKPAQIARKLVPAGGTIMIDAFGASFHLISCTGNRSVNISTDTTNAVPVSPGTTQEFPRLFRFKALQVENPNPFPVAVVIWYGFGAYTPHSYFLSEAATVVVGQALAGGIIAGGGGTVALNGVPSGNLVIRKAVIVSNDDPSQKLTITDGTNAVVRVYPFTSVRLDTSGPVVVRNDNGAAVSAVVSEIWYVAQ